MSNHYDCNVIAYCPRVSPAGANEAVVVGMVFAGFYVAVVVGGQELGYWGLLVMGVFED